MPLVDHLREIDPDHALGNYGNVPQAFILTQLQMEAAIKLAAAIDKAVALLERLEAKEDNFPPVQGKFAADVQFCPNRNCQWYGRRDQCLRYGEPDGMLLCPACSSQILGA